VCVLLSLVVLEAVALLRVAPNVVGVFGVLSFVVTPSGFCGGAVLLLHCPGVHLFV